MTTATRPRHRRRGFAAAAALTVLALTGACSAGGESTDGDDSSAGGSVAAPEPAADALAPDGAFADDQTVESASRDDSGGADAAGSEQKLISTGQVRLRSDDVGQAVFDVRNVVDKYAGEVEADNTETDGKGAPLRARLRVRVPTADFDEAMRELEDVATLVASSGDTKDVTTEVIDKDIRVDVQRRSIERIALLLDRAETIRDVVAIEAQLSQRQADLAVLEQEQRYLADQTSMATISVAVERTKEKQAPPPEEEDDDGFTAGLAAGWDALVGFGTGLATVLGALLPWLAVAAVLAVPGVPLWRRLRRRPGTTPAPAP